MTELLKKIDNNYLQLTLNLLLDTEREVIQLKLGFETGKEHSFSEIAEVLNLPCKQSAYQFYWQGINRIKNILAA